MSGSKEQSETSKVTTFQPPLKGFEVTFVHEPSGREMTVTGMGEGRVRFKALKKRRTAK